jgi:ribosomal protein S18 acetylase RimI-like enzyme
MGENSCQSLNYSIFIIRKFNIIIGCMISMKKHFLLFVAFFIAFEVCLIAASSSSYAMDYQFEDEGRSIVRGQKIQIEVDGELEITLSPLASFEDCLAVQLGLHDFNRKHIEDFPEWELKTPDGGQSVAQFFQESLVVEFGNLTSIGQQETSQFLSDVENNAYKRGARRSYTFVSAETLQDPNDHPQWVNKLKEHDYQCTEAFQALSTGYHFQLFYKELSVLQDQQDTLLERGYQWVCGEDGPKNFPGFFGVFVRKNGEIKGGVLGKINDKAVIPHCTIGVVWVDEILRGKNLGTRLMNCAFDYSKSCGVSTAELDTTSWQAAGFYEKLNFKKVLTIPRLHKTIDGQLSNVYGYRKEL